MSAPVGPYSPWRRAGDFVILSGQLGLVPGDNGPEFVPGDAADQLRQALLNAKALLAEAGATLNDVVKATLFLVDLADFTTCNDVWVEFFDAPRPTRSTIQVAALPMGGRAEAELWAYTPTN
ncbi:MAG: Rid family hydrolase [Actinomycetota bacterium]|jgi:2-iminobutanoate/2-iminopropanoate deaminase